MQPLTQSGRTFVLLCALTIAGRLALTFTTYGTNDVQFNTAWSALAEEAGIAAAYSYHPLLNHPPLSLALTTSFARVARLTGVEYRNVFRLFQILADCLSAFALYRIGRTRSEALGRALALFVLLSPAAAFVSAFHCNTDPAMIALTMLAASLLIVPEPRPGAAALALAAAAGIKIVPLLLFPIFFLAIPPKCRTRFALLFLAGVLVIFAPAIVWGGPVVVRNIFGYAGMLPYEWGVSGVAFAISRTVPSLHDVAGETMGLAMKYGRFVVYAAIAGVLAFVVARRPPLLRGVALMLLTLLAFAPAFGVQYIAWLIPVLPFALPWRWAIAVNAAASLFLFTTYTVWSGGLPWWFADITRPGPHRYVAALAGYAMWSIVCAALVAAYRSRSGVLESPSSARG